MELDGIQGGGVEKGESEDSCDQCDEESKEEESSREYGILAVKDLI